MKKFLSTNPNRLDPLGDPAQITPETAKKISGFLESTDDPFAGLVVSSAKRVVESKKAEKSKREANKSLPTTPGMAY
ncbi:MAG TPA: hypothetical protein VFP32_00730 [Candidatus Saccharimonadales bacterium]|nr:hypothetical protein [Candidatus Saccharimonadales bacterium]